MKIRNGFVSNSSSASFLIKTGSSDPLLRLALEVTGKSYKAITVYEVACEMLIASGRNKTLHDLKKLKGNYDYICFPSINEDTQIFYTDEGNIIVKTCNNESFAWRDAMEKIQKHVDAEIVESGESWEYPGFIDDEDKRVLKITEWEEADES